MKNHNTTLLSLLIIAALLSDRFYFSSAEDYQLNSTLWLICFVAVLGIGLVDRYFRKKKKMAGNKMNSFLSLLILAYLFYTLA